MTEKILLPIIAGPTACSKTEMGIKLALHMGGEIVGADSRQIYKHLDIGTAKPTMMERNLVPYHMIDFVELDQEYNVADYVQDSSGKILEIQSSSHIPILCGGTGLYIRRLIQGIFTIPEVGKEIRSQLQQLIHLKGMDYMYDQLMIVDPETASRLNKNDHIRIIRALEVYHSTGMTISKLQKHHT
ncbi:MAG: tRNA (adenosine(37)-N6)-dimethylallyltransferase MiaA, partial [Candidatus Schekmanbacteria bacterium RBG_13_48_7]